MTTSAQRVEAIFTDSAVNSPEERYSGSTPATPAKPSGRNAKPGTDSPSGGSALPLTEAMTSSAQYPTRTLTVQEIDRLVCKDEIAMAMFVGLREIRDNRPNLERNLRHAELQAKELKEMIGKADAKEEALVRALAIISAGDDRPQHLESIRKLVKDLKKGGK